MKLLYCPICQDVRKLLRVPVSCECGAVSGVYEEDGLNAKLSGNGIPIGIANGSFHKAIRHRPKYGLGQRFEAFVIPHECDTVRSV